MQSMLVNAFNKLRTMDLVLQIITIKTEKYTISIICLANNTILWNKTKPNVNDSHLLNVGKTIFSSDNRGKEECRMETYSILASKELKQQKVRQPHAMLDALHLNMTMLIIVKLIANMSQQLINNRMDKGTVIEISY